MLGNTSSKEYLLEYGKRSNKMSALPLPFLLPPTLLKRNLYVKKVAICISGGHNKPGIRSMKKHHIVVVGINKKEICYDLSKIYF